MVVKHELNYFSFKMLSNKFLLFTCRLPFHKVCSEHILCSAGYWILYDMSCTYPISPWFQILEIVPVEPELDPTCQDRDSSLSYPNGRCYLDNALSEQGAIWCPMFGQGVVQEEKFYPNLV